MLFMMLFSFSEQSSASPSADMATEDQGDGASVRDERSAGSQELLPDLGAGCLRRKLVLGAIEPELVMGQGCIDEGAMVRGRAFANMRAKVPTRDAHAAHRDEPLLLQRADHLHNAGVERRLFLWGQVSHRTCQELRP